MLRFGAQHYGRAVRAIFGVPRDDLSTLENTLRRRQDKDPLL
jgi:hypothetical protein